MFPARLSARVSVEIYWPLKQRPTKFSKHVINEDIIQTSLCACATAQSLRHSKCQATKQVDLTINGRSKAMASGQLTVPPSLIVESRVEESNLNAIFQSRYNKERINRAPFGW